MAWKKVELADGTRAYEAQGYRVEPGWRWSSRTGTRLPDGWEAYRGAGPTRILVGSFDKLDEAKDACLADQGEEGR